MEFSEILYDVRDRVATLTLNRPTKRNALNEPLLRDLTAGVIAASRDPAAKVVVLRAEGPAFCSGADLEELARIQQLDLEENRVDSGRLVTLLRTLQEMRKPVIAAVQGPALAGGAGLASACDFVIASRERATFGYPEVAIGFIPAIVLVFLVKRVGEGRARELVLRGHTIPAEHAAAIGLITTAVPHEEVDSAARALARELVEKNSGNAMGLCKDILAKQQGMNMTEALDFAANMNAAARMTADCKNGIAGFLEKRPPTW
jgi:methylglutaconyl-CoA hydratase